MLEMLLTSSALILIVLALRRLFRDRISLRLQYSLWLLVALRLLIPGSLLQSPVSVLSGAETVAQRVTELHRDTPDTSDMDANAVLSPITPDAAEKAPPVLSVSGDAAAIQTVIPTAPSQTFSASDPLISWADAARFVWYAGMIIMALWFLISNLYFRRELKYGAALVSVPGSPLPVYVTGGVSSPCLYGLLRPAIYVTRDCLDDEQRLRHVIAHEATHRRHGDQFWSLVRCLCLVVWWFNPLVWLAAVLSRRDCELACDEGALKRLGEGERLAYGRTLIGVVAQSSVPGALLRTATTMSGSKKAIRERITLIAKRPRMTAATLTAVLLIAVLAVGCTFSGAAEPSEEPDETGVQLLRKQSAEFPDSLAGESPDSLVSKTTQPLSGSALEMAQTLYAAITGDLDFYALVSDQGVTTRVHVTADVYEPAFYDAFFTTFHWTSIFDSINPPGAFLTLESSDGTNYLRCWEESDVVLLHWEGTNTWISAAPNDDETTFYQFLTYIPEGALHAQGSNAAAKESPVVETVSYDDRVTDGEIVLSNGVRLHMAYDEVTALIGYKGAATPTMAPDAVFFWCDNISYTFRLNGAGKLVLVSIGLDAGTEGVSAFRDIQVGDSIQSVFSKIPARDTELKKWAEQTLYGSDPNDEFGYAKLEFVAMSYYSMSILTPECCIDIKFTRDDICVQWINITVRD